MKVNVRKLSENAVIPFYSKEGDNGLDLVAISKDSDERGVVTYGTGIAIEIPIGYVGIITPRSSISDLDVSLANSVGTIDSNYRGELKLKFKPDATETWREEWAGDRLQWQYVTGQEYNIGDKIGQLLILPCPRIELCEVDELSTTERNELGFGSSGK